MNHRHFPGDPDLAGERLELLRKIPLLQLEPEIDEIAGEIMSRSILPVKARRASHSNCGASRRVDYLLTWNCAHIANARNLPRIHSVLSELGCFVPIICTPEEMVDDDLPG